MKGLTKLDQLKKKNHEDLKEEITFCNLDITGSL